MQKALVAFADFMNCVSADFHIMHWLYYGDEFDAMHKKVLKKYYEEAGNDYDDLNEWAVGLGERVGNPSNSKARISYPDYEPEKVTRQEAVMKCNELIEQICLGFNILVQGCKDTSAIQVGLSNLLQTRLEYWSKELIYFNGRRSDNMKYTLEKAE